MKRHGARRGAAVTLVTAAAVLLAGCGGGDGGSGAGDGRNGKDGRAGKEERSGAAAGPSAPAEDSKGPDAGGVPSGPKEPVSELTPVTGSFSKKEKKYLAGRVPRGQDPAAVLEGGQEACDRLAFLERRNEDMAVSALILGEIRGARDAVTHLCPRRMPLVEAADRGFPDGEFTVGERRKAGSTIVPGRYRSPGPGPSGAGTGGDGDVEECVWRITGAGGKKLDSGSGRSQGGDIEITIPAAARGFSSAGCHSWLNPGGTG
ncbi:hypothetical protein [Streptomyces xinghaiensis]|uniref:hypothetical protein n=1 Tax=Streptomyces xinghaiensis TaxID=1038928 RepID=UPI00030A33FA|nr:hypothetical protein [Streptomyces xinghaiensis]MZE81222.1 hypothetical protein [Streptomyces sp. SID5475]